MAQQRKKSTSRRSGPRRKKRGDWGKKLKSFLSVPVGVLLLIMLFYIGFLIGQDLGRHEEGAALAEARQEIIECKNDLGRLRSVQTEKISAGHEYDHTPPQPAKRKAIPRDKPELAIIIDDVSFAHEVSHIKALGMTLTMSFLPPTNTHPTSAKLAEKEPFYMVHLPLEAVSYSAEEPKTLEADDSLETIDSRIREIKNLFPGARYVNNHTGSKFTADMVAMKMLIYALDREGMTFVDSRTTGKTVVPALMKSLHRPYISRDVFLDHDPDIDAVKAQIKRAVAIAEKYGSAIAIGHPHRNTLKALSESKDVLQKVQLVQIDTLVAQTR